MSDTIIAAPFNLLGKRQPDFPPPSQRVIRDHLTLLAPDVAAKVYNKPETLPAVIAAPVVEKAKPVHYERVCHRRDYDGHDMTIRVYADESIDLELDHWKYESGRTKTLTGVQAREFYRVWRAKVVGATFDVDWVSAEWWNVRGRKTFFVRLALVGNGFDNQILISETEAMRAYRSVHNCPFVKEY